MKLYRSQLQEIQNNTNTVSSNIVYLEKLNSNIPSPRPSASFIDQITQFAVALFESLPAISTLIVNPINNSCENDIGGLVPVYLKLIQGGGFPENDTRTITTLQNYPVDCKDMPAGIQDEWVHEAYAKQQGSHMMTKECTDVIPMMKNIDQNAIQGGTGYPQYATKQNSDLSKLVTEAVICSSFNLPINGTSS